MSTGGALSTCRRLASAGLVFGALAAAPALAQQLEPRAYSPSPVGANFAGVLYANSSGDVLLDPSLPLRNVSTHVNLVTAYYVRTFGFFGRSASVAITLPYAWGTVQGDVGEAFRRVERSGLGDASFRFAVNIVGGPALGPREFAVRKHKTSLGVSLTMTGPTGQYDPSKLVNLGTNRWAFKPEIGLTQPLGRWWLELYAGVWLFTTNDDFYGGQTREQDPISVLQGHVVYEFQKRMWLALDGTWYGGGTTTVNGVVNADRQDNSRVGVTFAVPLPHRQAIKLAYARGASARIGSKLNTLALAWQILWFDPPAARAKP